jgi:hypothetical protein
MKTGRKYRLGIAIAAAAALTPCCTWIGWNHRPAEVIASDDPPRPRPTPPPQILSPDPTPLRPDPQPPAPGPRSDSFPVAKPVPGKEGFVFSPFNNHLIDIKGFKSGTLVSDPRFQLSERKFFRVP